MSKRQSINQPGMVLRDGVLVGFRSTVNYASGLSLSDDPAAGLVTVTATSSVTRITQQSDFGEVVDGEITVSDGTYYLGNNVDIEPGVRLVVDATLSGRVCLRADGPHIHLRGDVDAGAFVSLPNQGVISHISVVNEGSGDVVEIAARTSTTFDANANFAFLFDANIVSPSDLSPSSALIRVLGDDDGREPPRVKLNNCNIGSVALEGSIVFQDGAADFADIVGTLLPAPVGPSVLLRSSFTGFNFGASVLGGTLGAIAGQPAITVEPGATIVVPGSERLLLVESVNIAGVLDGLSVADSDVLFVGNQGLRNSLFVGAGAFVGNVTPTTFVDPATFVAVEGALSASPEQQRFVESGGEFTYQGNAPRDAVVYWSASFFRSGGGGSPLVAFRVERRPDGGVFSVVADSQMGTEALSRENAISGFASTALDPLDTLRVTIANLETTQEVTVTDFQVRVDAS